MIAPMGGYLEFFANASMMGLAVWSAIVGSNSKGSWFESWSGYLSSGNLNWSIFILLGLGIGLMNEELIAAIVGTEIFERWGTRYHGNRSLGRARFVCISGCRGRRLIEPLTEEKVERTMMRAVICMTY